jgi:uncharacterized protein HemY
MAARKTRSKVGGARTGAGRKKGVPNRLTTAVKEAIEKAFDSVGGHEYLARVAQQDPRTFCTLLSKIAKGAADRHVTFALPEIKTADDAAKASAEVLGLAGKGEMSLEEAQAVADLIENYRRTLETSELDARMREIEERLQ